MNNLIIQLDSERAQEWFCDVIGISYKKLNKVAYEDHEKFVSFWNNEIGMEEVEINFSYGYDKDEPSVGYEGGFYFFDWEYKDKEGDWIDFELPPNWMEDMAIEFLFAWEV